MNPDVAFRKLHQQRPSSLPVLSVAIFRRIGQDLRTQVLKISEAKGLRKCVSLHPTPYTQPQPKIKLRKSYRY